MIISVRGSHRTTIPPERAVLRLELSDQGPDGSQVFSRVQRRAAELLADIERLREAVPPVVVEHEVRAPTTSSWQPSDHQGRPRPPVHSASAAATITFVDPSVAADFLARWGSTPGVNIGGLRWELSRDTEEACQADVLAEAVRRARERALVIARASGFVDVTAVEITDPGLMASRPERHMLTSGAAQDGVAFGAARGIDVVEPTPTDVVVTATVEARFEAR